MWETSFDNMLSNGRNEDKACRGWFREQLTPLVTLLGSREIQQNPPKIERPRPRAPFVPKTREVLPHVHKHRHQEEHRLHQEEREVPSSPRALLRAADPAPRRIAYLHIGPHKTGTSAFQWRAHQQAGDLGLVSVGMTNTERRQVGRVVKGLCTGPEPTELGLKMARTLNADIIAKDSDVILSHEIFDHCSGEKWVAVRDVLLAEFDVRVLAVRRDPFNHAISAWNQRTIVSTSGTRWQTTPETFILRMAGKGNRACNELSADCVASLAATYGAANLHLASFEGLVAQERDLFDLLACDIVRACSGGIGSKFPVPLPSGAGDEADDAQIHSNRSPSQLVQGAQSLLAQFLSFGGCHYGIIQKAGWTDGRAGAKAVWPGAVELAAILEDLGCVRCLVRATLPSIFRNVELDVEATRASGVHTHAFEDASSYVQEDMCYPDSFKVFTNEVALKHVRRIALTMHKKLKCKANV